MNTKDIFEKILKGVGIAAAGGGIAIGAGTVNIVDADFLTIIYVVVASSLFNAIYQFLRGKINK